MKGEVGRTGLERAAIWAIAVACVVAGTAAYLELKDAPFIYDDLHAIRDNPNLRDSISPLPYFQDPQSSDLFPTTMVRPLLTWTYALDFRRAGQPDPDPFRQTNFLLHLANAALVVALTRATRLRRLAPLAGAIFFIHPLGSIEVGYVSSRSTLLSSFFYLAALTVFAHAHRAGRTVGGRGLLAAAAAAALFGLGLLAKEVAASAPLAIAAWALIFRPGPGPDQPMTSVRARPWLAVSTIGLMAAALLGYLAYRHAHQAPTLFPPARPWPVWVYASSQVQVFWTYLRLLFLPIGLALEHDAWTPTASADLVSLRFIAAAVGLGLFVGAAWLLRRGREELAFAAVFTIVYLLPTSSVVPLTMLVNENRPYLAILLPAWLILGLLGAAAGRPKAGLATAAAILSLYAALLFGRPGLYQNPERLWREAVEAAPNLGRAWVNLGEVWSSYGRLDEAGRADRVAVRLEPCNAAALTNLGNFEQREARRPTAEEFYRRALACDPGRAAAALNLADLLAAFGREPDAGAVLERALAFQPRDPRLLERVGARLLKNGERERGLGLLTDALRFSIDPEQRPRLRALIEKSAEKQYKR